MAELTDPTMDDPRRRQPRAPTLQLELTRDVRAPAAARAALSGWCPELDGGEPRRETLMLLVSELVTNAVLHSGGPADAPIRVAASVEEETVRVAVTDPGEGFTPAVREPQKTATVGGYGLYIVAQAAHTWGVDEDDGTRVWFEL